jgi:nucleotide-binding universal stress UspA family protein
MDSPIKRILVYVDGSEQSITAAQYSICLAKYLKAGLYALYVVNTRALNELLNARIFLKSEQEEYQHDLEADAGKYLNHVRELARRKGLAIETLLTSGTVHTEVKNILAERKIDLFIVGELSNIRSRRDEFYNESERAMRIAPCPVVIVKDDDRVYRMYDELE